MTQPPVGPPPSDPGPPEYPAYPTYPPVGPPPASGFPPAHPTSPAGFEPYPPYPPYPQANPSGYPPPGYPSQPSPYGYPAAGTYPPIESARGTNGFAIAALILGIIPICAGILGIVFGFVSLSQIKQTGQKGRGMAITGIVLGFVWIAVVAVGVAVGASNSPKRDDTGHITQPGQMDVTKLRVGDCVAELGDEKFYTTTKAIPCLQPHKAEVYALLPLLGTSVPDMSTMEKTAQGCGGALERYSPSAYDDDAVEVTYLYPTRQSWKQGDHSITCIATFPTDRSDSIKGK
ncbi:MAG: DUF4190 domain-containing protein [Mycobacterium sp.]